MKGASFYDLDKLVISHIKSFLDVDSYRNVLLTATLFHTKPNEALLELLEIQKEYNEIKEFCEQENRICVKRCYQSGCRAYQITDGIGMVHSEFNNGEFVDNCFLCQVAICEEHWEEDDPSSVDYKVLCFNCRPVYKKHKNK